MSLFSITDFFFFFLVIYFIWDWGVLQPSDYSVIIWNKVVSGVIWSWIPKHRSLICHVAILRSQPIILQTAKLSYKELFIFMIYRKFPSSTNKLFFLLFEYCAQRSSQSLLSSLSLIYRSQSSNIKIFSLPHYMFIDFYFQSTLVILKRNTFTSF